MRMRCALTPSPLAGGCPGTIYEDGQDFEHVELATALWRLMERGVQVAIVTAAGYSEPALYEKRLRGLLDFFSEASDPCWPPT